MDRRQRFVTLSAIPLALIGIGALWVAAANVSSGRDDAMFWAAIGLAAGASAIGVTRGMRWALLAEAVLGLFVTIGVGLMTAFSLAMSATTGGSLDGGMFGTPFGVLNGWASLVLYAIGLGAGVWMLAAGISGRRPRQPGL